MLLSLFSNGHLPWTDSESDTELHRKKADCDIKALAKQCNAEEVSVVIELLHRYAKDDYIGWEDDCGMSCYELH